MRLQQKRPPAERWVVKKDHEDVYRGSSAGRALAAVAEDDLVRVYLNGRLVYPPPDHLPIPKVEG